MLKYYPLTRIITNRYTRGNEFALENGKPYAGRYYTTYTGESFTGINPVLGASEPLVPLSLERAQRRFRTDFITGTATINSAVPYEISTGRAEVEDTGLQELTPYYPAPGEDDYQRGYFTRYFAKNVSGPGYIFEISRKAWGMIQNGEIPDNVLAYETADILWQLTGPLNNKRISQYQVQGGVYDTNKRVTEAEAKTFRGLVEFIGGDYTKFARITP